MKQTFCVGCGVAFPQKKWKPRFHNRQCYLDYYKRSAVCPGCGKPFRKKTRDQKYCSPDCGNKARRKVRMDICVGCGVSYMQKRPEQKYHSIECGAQARGCKSAGKRSSTYAPKYGAELVASVMAEIGVGTPKAEIARKLGVGRTTVWRVCRHV